MRTGPLAPLALTIALVSACSDRARTILGPSESETVLAKAPPQCDVNWKKAVSGKWENPSAWDRGSVPRPADKVCITTPGQYVVLAARGFAGEVYVGDGMSAIELALIGRTAQPSLVAGEIIVERGAWLRTYPDSRLEANVVDVAGRVALDGGALDLHNVTLRDSAIVFVNDSATITGLGSVSTAGDVYLNDDLTLEMLDGGLVEFNAGGLVSGVPGSLEIRPVSGGNARVAWNGGQLYSSPANGEALVTARGADVELPNSGYGFLDVIPDGKSIEISGTLSSLGTLRIRKEANDASGHVTLNNFYNAGQLDLIGSTGHALRIGGGLVNEGTITTGPGEVSLEPDSIVNGGTFAVGDAVRLTRGRLRNRGLVTVSGSVADLIVTGTGMFLADPAGEVEGTLIADAGGVIGGSGELERVVSAGGTISPGEFRAEFGSLTFDTLILDAASTTVVELTGVFGINDQADRIEVREYLTLAGTMDTRIHLYYIGGECGDMVQPITWNASAQQSGAFAQAASLPIDSASGFRVHLAPQAVELIGFDPNSPLGIADGEIWTSEQSITDSTAVCLSGPAPSSDVTVTGVSPNGQSIILDTVTFTVADWMYPKQVRIGAIDDALVEPYWHFDTLRFDLTSTDPEYTGTVPRVVENLITENDPGPDLTVAHVGGPTVVTVDQQFEAAFEITNNGPGSSSGAHFYFAGLSGMIYVSDGAGVQCVGSSTVFCTTDAIPQGAALRFTILFRAVTAGVHANLATMVGMEIDPTGPSFLTYTVEVN